MKSMTGTQPLFEKLLGLLHEEVSLYDAILESVKKERDAILTNNIDALTSSTEKKQFVLSQLQKFEQQRQSAVGDLAESLGRSADELRLEDLSQAADAAHASELKACRSRLLSVTQAISDMGNQNRKLILHALKRVRNSFTFLHQLTVPDMVYRPTGKMHSSDRSGRFLSNEI